MGDSGVVQGARLDELTERLLGALGEGVYGIDAGGRATFLNPAAEQLLGYTAEEFVGRRQHEAIHPWRADGSPYPADQCAIYAVLEDGQERRVTGELFRRRDGTSFPVEYTAAPVLHEGRLVGAVVVFRDISERLQSEEELSRATLLQQAMLENLPDAAWMKDAELRYVAVNEAFIAASGHPRAAFLGHTVRELRPPEVAARFEQDDRRVLETDETLVMEQLLPWRGGVEGLRWVETIKRALPRVDGRPTGLVAIARDVTDRRRREEVERFLAEAGEVIIASLGWTETLQGVATLVVPALGDWCVTSVFDDEGAVDGVVVQASDPALMSYLRERAEAEPDRWGPESDLVGRALLAGSGELLADLSAAEIRQLVGDPAVFRELAPLPYSAVVIPLIAKTRARGVLVLVRSNEHRASFDAMDRVVLEQVGQRAGLALEHARQHRAANEALHARDEVLRVVAHDLHSLVATTGLSAGLLDDADLAGTHARALERIHAATERMDRLIQDIVDVSRVETGWLPLEPAEIDAAVVLNEAVGAAEPLARDRDIDLVLERPDELPTLRADHDRTLQVFSNLLGNAIKFTPRGGRVLVNVQVMGDELLICVRDTGPGIPEDQLAHVFDRFWRGRNGPGRGLGLGLSIARGVVSAQGGRIWASSEVGKGSRFCFTVPTQSEDGPVPDSEAGSCLCMESPEPQDGGGLATGSPVRVLVVDDHDAIRHGVRATLEAAADMEIVGEASTGSEAVAAAARLTPDVVIMDLSLPEMDGFEAMRRISALDEGSIRALVLTAHAPEKSLMKAMKAGAFGFVRKATAHDDLLPAVRAVMRGEVFLDTHSNGVLLRALERTREAERRLSALTENETDILRLTAEGYTANEIGERIFLSPHTVASYRSRAMRKLGLEHRSDLVRFALDTELITTDE